MDGHGALRAPEKKAPRAQHATRRGEGGRTGTDTAEMIAESSTAKLAGYPLALGMPLLAPLGVWMDMPWLAPLIVFGAFPILSVLIGEDRSFPVVGARRACALLAYLRF